MQLQKEIENNLEILLAVYDNQMKAKDYKSAVKTIDHIERELAKLEANEIKLKTYLH